jgi:hypothetical protein
MFNSVSSPQPGSYFDLQQRVTHSLQSAKVDDQIFEAVQRLFEETLSSGKIVLSRPERNRLLRDVMKLVLGDMLEKMSDHK